MRNIFNIRYLKQGLLLTAFTVCGSSPSYSLAPYEILQKYQGMQVELQAAQAQVAQMTTALAQEQAAHQQDLQNFNQCQVEKGSGQAEITQLQQILEQTKAAHTAALAQVDTVHANALAQAQSAHNTAFEHAHATHQQELREALTQAHSTHATTLEQARVTHAAALEQANVTHHQQLQQAVEQAQAGHQQQLQETLAQAHSTHSIALEEAKAAHASALLEAQNTHAVALDQVKNAHSLQIADHQQQLQAAQQKQQDLERQLIVAQTAVGGGDPQQITSLQEEISKLQQELVKYNPSTVAGSINLPSYNNPENYIYPAQILNADPELARAVDEARVKAKHYIEELTNNINTLITGKGVMIARMQVRNTLRELKSTFDPNDYPDIHQIEWDALKQWKGKITNNENNFDRILSTNPDLVGLKEQLTLLDNLSEAVQKENTVNVFNLKQEKIRNSEPNLGPLEGLADNFISTQIPALRGLLTKNYPYLINETINKIIEKIQKGEFDLLQKQLGETVKGLGSSTMDVLKRQLGALKVMENYKDAVDSYMVQLKNLTDNDPAVKDIYFLRYGIKRFEAALRALDGRHIDPSQPRYDEILQNILSTPDPLNLKGEERKKFANYIDMLKDEKNTILQPIADEVKNLTGSYNQITRATVSLYTDTNKLIKQ